MHPNVVPPHLGSIGPLYCSCARASHKIPTAPWYSHETGFASVPTFLIGRFVISLPSLGYSIRKGTVAENSCFDCHRPALTSGITACSNTVSAPLSCYFGGYACLMRRGFASTIFFAEAGLYLRFRLVILNTPIPTCQRAFLHCTSPLAFDRCFVRLSIAARFVRMELMSIRPVKISNLHLLVRAGPIVIL